MSAIGTQLIVEAALRLGTLIDAHARDAGRQLGEWLRPWLGDRETLPDFRLVLELQGRMIRQASQDLRERQGQLDDARSREAAARYRRDQTASALRRKLVEIRRLLTSVLGPRRTAELAGIEGSTAQASQSALLLSQSQAFLKLLRDPRRLAVPQTGWYIDPRRGGHRPRAARRRVPRGLRSSRRASPRQRGATRSQRSRADRAPARSRERRPHARRMAPAHRPGGPG